MGLFGNLDTMSLEELLHWVETGRKTGTLELERDKICKRIMFEEGRVVACSSNDPATRIGQFLLARGTITEGTLREALSRQQQSAKNLGEILAEMGAIDEETSALFVQAKIEETIYGLFDWNEAVFRFDSDAEEDPNAVEVDLEIREVLDRGRQRYTEVKESKETLDDPRIVLRRTPDVDVPFITDKLTATRILELIDGRRTVADILIHSHAPEFLVSRFLTALLKEGAVEITGVKDNEPPIVEIEASPAPVETPEILDPATSAVESHGIDCPAWNFGDEIGAEAVEQPEVEETVTFAESENAPAVKGDINVALQLMASGQAEAALELLNAMLEAFPSDGALRHLVDNAENEFRTSLLAGELALTRIPVRTAGAEKPLGPEESFLHGLIDGENDIRAILWVAPLREVDALKALQSLLRKGLIEVH